MTQSGDSAAEQWKSLTFLPLHDLLGIDLSDPTRKVFGAIFRAIKLGHPISVSDDWQIAGDVARRVEIASLMVEARVSRQSVTRAIPDLVKASLIEATQGTNRIWSIRLLPPPATLCPRGTRSRPTGARVTPDRREGHAPEARGSRPTGVTILSYREERVREKPEVVPAHFGSKAPQLSDVLSEDLASTGRLDELFRQAVELGWANGCYLGPGGQLDFVASSEHATRIVRRDGGDACKLFAWILRKGQWQVVTNADEQVAHRQLREYLYPSIPRQTRPALSSDARLVQHFVRAARRHGCHDPPTRLYEVLSDHLGEEWTKERWNDAVAELEDGGGPVPVGRLTETLLARYEITEPTIRLYDAEGRDDAKQRHAAAG